MLLSILTLTHLFFLLLQFFLSTISALTIWFRLDKDNGNGKKLWLRYGKEIKTLFRKKIVIMAYLRKHELVLNMGNGRQSLDAETFNGNVNPWVVLLHSICLNSRITYGNKISCIDVLLKAASSIRVWSIHISCNILILQEVRDSSLHLVQLA